MIATETSDLRSVTQVAEDNGRQQMKLRVLKWLFNHRDELPQRLIDSLVDEVNK